MLGGAGLLDNTAAVFDGPATLFEGNSAAGFGGALFLDNGASVELRGRVSFASNAGEQGGGVSLDHGSHMVFNGIAAFYGALIDDKRIRTKVNVILMLIVRLMR